MIAASGPPSPQCPDQRVSAEPGDNSIASLYEILGVTTTTPSRYAARDELLRHLLSALDTLPHDYQKAIRLYDLEDSCKLFWANRRSQASKV